MGLFTGVGDFFRGAFGEDEEEKRRRKQREAGAAADRRVAARPQQQQQNRPAYTGMGSKLFGQKSPDPTKLKTQPKPLFQQMKEEASKSPKPPAPRPLPDKEFLDVSEGEKRQKTIFGKNAAWILPKGNEQVTKVEANKTFTTNKDKYVAGYDKLQPQKQKILVNTARQRAAQGDKAAINTLKALEETGRLKGSFSDFVEGSNERFYGGLTRGTLRTADLLLPGKNTFGLEREADRQDASKTGQRQITDAGRTGEAVGTFQKGITDIATIALPQSKIDKLAEGTKVYQTFKDGSKLMQIGGKLVKVIPGSVAGTGIDYLQQRGRGEEADLKKSLATGLTLDLLVDSLPGGVGRLRRYFGKGKGGSELIDDAVEAGIGATSGGARVADDAARALREGDDVERQLANLTDEELSKLADDVDTPAYQRADAKAEVARRAEQTANDLVPNDLPVDTVPAYQARKAIDDVVRGETEKLTRYINENPQLTRQQIEAAQEATKQRIIDLTSELQASRRAGLEALDTQATAQDAAQQARAVTNEQVAAEQAARTTPPPGDVVEATPQSPSPEVGANDAYAPGRQSTDEILYGDTTQFKEKGRLSIPQLFSPDRVIRENISRGGEELVNKGISALQTSDSRLGRGFGRLFSGFSNEAGVDRALQQARMQMRGGIELGKINREAIGDLAGDMSKEDLTDIWATIDRDLADRMGKNVDVADLSPEQQALRQKLVDIRDNTTVENMRRGLITKEQAANGEYITRDYSNLYDKEGEVGKFEQGFRNELLGQYKGRKQVSEKQLEEAITDPTYLVGKKQAQSEAAWKMQDYGNYLANSGRVVDAPQPGFVQLPDTPLFGDAAGKYVPKNIAEDFTGFQYDMAMVSSFNDFITAYDRLGIRQGKKQLLTVFNPAVRLGNQVTNRGIFSQLAGINPLQFNWAMDAAKKEIAGRGQLFREAVEQGLTGVDITQADFFARRVGESAQDPNLAKKALNWVKTSYSGADDQARIAAYMIKRNQGYTAEEAARQVQRGFQDYKSVGFFYDMAAKTPIIGNAFVRFAADSMRIAKNAAIDHPLRTLSTVALWSAFVNGMSVVSGESDLKGDSIASKAFNLATGQSKSDAQKERESRFGSPKIPFTDVSLAVQTPFGEVNVARFAPWYNLNNIEGSGLTKVLPFNQSPVKIEDGKIALEPQAMNDPLLGQLVQIGIDKDFRGKSIRDPESNPDRPDMFRDDPLSSDDQRNNVLRFLFNNNALLGRETDAVYSAIKGQEDIYGKERSVPQALLRAAGFKIEQQGDKQRQDRQSMQEYLDEAAEIEKEVQGMSPSAQEAYKRLTGYYKLRDEVPNEFDPTKTRKVKAPQYEFSEDKWKEYAAHPELYDLMVQKKQREFAKDGKPIPPEFDPRLSEGFRRQLLQNKMVAPGDDAELDQRMYSTPEWDYYQNLKDQYSKAASQYYPDSGDDFKDELVRNQDEKFPDKPGILKAYSAAYQQYLDGKRDKPQWSDELTAIKEQYNKQTFDWTNQERAARGLPAITWDIWNNPTFGFDESPSGSGYGFGGGGGGGSRTVDMTTDLSNFTSTVKRLDPMEAQASPNIVALFQKLRAGSGGGRAKPKLGASSSGR